MRSAARSVVALLVICAALIAAVPVTMGNLVRLTATALYMGGTDHPLSIPGDTPAYINDYVDWAYGNFVGPSGLCGPVCAPVAVYTPEQFWPMQGRKAMTFDESVAAGLVNLDNCLRSKVCTVTDPPFTSTVSRALADTDFTVFGYSQSGTIASIQKSNLIAHPPAGTVSFVFESNPNRPNGGVLERFAGTYVPILDVTFSGATVTNSPQPTPLTTVDIAHQYDPVADFPTNPLRPLSLINTLMGFRYEHPEGAAGTPQLQGQYQDSTYYLIPTTTLPLLQPLTILPWFGPLIATVADPPLRVLVESGYDRTVNPGSPTPAKFLYHPKPVRTGVNVLKAIPNGWDNGIAYITKDPDNRPFGTTPQGPYGVGGPPVDAGAIDPYGPPTPAATPAESVTMRRTSPIRRLPVRAKATAEPRAASAQPKQRRAARGTGAEHRHPAVRGSDAA
ncbi:MAG: PE-PPE domain-containing protein [Mycobacterium sp.]